MTDFWIGASCVVTILLLIGLRFHIGLAMAAVSCVGIWIIAGPRAVVSIVQTVPYSFAASWDFSAIPLFIFMGTIAYVSGMTDLLFRTARLWLSWLPGGLAISANFGAAGFSAATGSSLVASMAIGRIAVPEMLKYRYDKGLATGVVAAAGTLGVMIPPSIPMIIYAYFAEISIGRIFMAGILPGLLTALAYSAMIAARASLNPKLAPPVADDVSPSEKWKALLEVWPLPTVILAVIGTIYFGIASATDSAAFGAVAAIIIALLQRRLNWENFRRAVLETVRNTAAVFFVIIGAVLLTRLMAYSDLPETLSQMVTAANLPPLALVLAIGAILLVLGCFLDPMGLLLLTLPVFLPILNASGINLIWFGILFIKFIEIGLITPPVGMNVFVMKSLFPDIPLKTVFGGIVWFFIAELVVVALLIGFPQISLFLPGLLS